VVPIVVEIVVVEAPAAVAGEAKRLVVEQHEATLGRVGDRGLVAADPAVEGRRARARTTSRRRRSPLAIDSRLTGAFGSAALKRAT